MEMPHDFITDLLRYSLFDFGVRLFFLSCLQTDSELKPSDGSCYV